MTIILSARFRAQNAEAAEKIEKHLKGLRDYSLSDKEPGCSLYYPTRGREDPLAFSVFEEYADQAAIDTHMASPLFQAFGAEADSLLENGLKGGLEIAYYNRL